MSNNSNATEPSAKSSSTNNEENRWIMRLEELLKVKNMDDLKSELTKLAGEIQTEIQNFDINSHLSPEAKTRLKNLEKRYSEVIRSVQKAQKEFDREFNKRLRVLKRTKQDAEKQIKNIKVKIAKQRGAIVKASNDLKRKIQKTSAKKVTKAKRKTTVRKKTTA